MAQPLNSLLSLSSFDKSQILQFFDSTQYFQNSDSDHKNLKKDLNLTNKIAALLFFEPSTRTRFSFEAACLRLNVQPMTLAGAQSTSLEKGETLEDCFINMAQLEPDLFIIRAPQEFPLSELAAISKVPILNAGWGVESHPTQALLDFYTLYKFNKNFAGLKIVYVGDTAHSRVVKSHLQLAHILNVQAGICSPESMRLKGTEILGSSPVKFFSELESALDWADVIYMLRVQKERFQSQDKENVNMSTFSLIQKFESKLHHHQLIMHPGPVNYGVEIDQSMARHKNSIILDQVKNGLHVRKQLIANLFNQGVFL